MVPKLDGVADDNSAGGTTPENFVAPVMLERGADVKPLQAVEVT